MKKASSEPQPIEHVDTVFLKGLLGYNTRRATLMIFKVFDQRVSEFELSPVDFSVLCLIGRNPNITPSQLSTALDLLPPYLAKILTRFTRRHLIIKVKPEADKRAFMLSLSQEGKALLNHLEGVVAQLERDAASLLTDKQLETLIKHLQKIYAPEPT
jgi:DNA-binding MarR family transcriptional regulator